MHAGCQCMCLFFPVHALLLLCAKNTNHPRRPARTTTKTPPKRPMSAGPQRSAPIPAAVIQVLLLIGLPLGTFVLVYHPRSVLLGLGQA